MLYLFYHRYSVSSLFLMEVVYILAFWLTRGQQLQQLHGMDWRKYLCWSLIIVWHYCKVIGSPGGQAPTNQSSTNFVRITPFHCCSNHESTQKGNVFPVCPTLWLLLISGKIKFLCNSRCWDDSLLIKTILRFESWHTWFFSI